MTDIPNTNNDLNSLQSVQWALDWASGVARAQANCSARMESNHLNLVYRLDFPNRQCFLKVGPNLRREYERMRWLEGRLPAPRALGLISHKGLDALLTTAINGHGLASLSATPPPDTIIARLASALHTVHALPVTDWPFGGDGRVIVHGDACLPNFIYDSDTLSGYIDVGDMAKGDPQTDLSAAVWSLQYNMGPGHGVAFLRAYGLEDATEEEVERLRSLY